MISREEAINLLDNLKGFIEDSQNNDYDGAIKIAISEMQKLEKIKQIIANQDELIAKIYGVAIPEGFADLFEMISQIVKEVE